MASRKSKPATVRNWAPCPFCGAPPLATDVIEGRYRVICDSESCGATGPHAASHAAAVRAWNRRSKQ